MSTQNEDYLASKIAAGCAPEHVAITEGDDNSAGIVMDTHKLAEGAPEWDPIRNSDIETLSTRIVSLEKKVGEPGWDSAAAEYTPLPKSPSIPKYLDPYGASNLTVGHGGQNTTYSIGENLQYIQPGDAHSKALVLQSKALLELTRRSGLPLSNVQQPDTTLNFTGTTKNGATESYPVINSVTVAFPGGTEITPPSLVATTASKLFPAYYDSKDTPTEAIAKLDFSTFNAIADMQAQMNRLAHQVNESFKQIDDIKKALMEDNVIIIDPSWEVDDNGLQPGNDTNYVSSVSYSLTLNNDSGSGTPMVFSSSAKTTIAGVVNTLSYPFLVTLRLEDIVAPYNPGTVTDLSMVITATDQQGNSTTTSVSNRPV